MDAVERILEDWNGQRVPLNPGAAAQDLAALEAFLGCALPADVRRFYSAANGMQDYARDSKTVSFWSIHRILREKDVARAGDGAQGTAFADVMMYAWTFRYGVGGGRLQSVMVDGSPHEQESFSAFLDQYVSDPKSLGLVDAV
jgi:hypothetical protein